MFQRHTTNFLVVGVLLRLIDIAFELKLLLSDPVRFVPVEFRFPDTTILQSNFPDSFYLSPLSTAVPFAKPKEGSNGASRSYGRDVVERPDKIEVHILRDSASRLNDEHIAPALADLSGSYPAIARRFQGFLPVSQKIIFTPN